MESDDSYSSADEEILEETAASPEPELDEAAKAERLKDILTSVEARNARFEALLSLIPPEQFQHLSDQEEPVVHKSKKQRRAEVAKREKEVKDAKKAIKVERASAKSKGKERAVEMDEDVLPPVPSQEKPSTADLRAKLDSKIKALQAARAPTREGLLADRRAKRERQAERKREERKQARKDAKRAQAGPSSSLLNPVDPPPAPSAEDALALEQVKRASTTVAFGHFDFAPTSAVRAVDSDRKRKGKASSSSHDPKQALAALEDRQRFLSTHSADAKERAEDKDRWTAMAARAEGAKVYDDEAKLRKAIKKQEKLKKRAKQKWADRQQTVEEAQAARQQLRAYNLAKRKEEAKSKGKSKKARPGFEGGPAPKRAAHAGKSSKAASSSRPRGKPIARPT